MPARKQVANADGSVSSEMSVTVTDARLNDGKPTNIPTMFDGKRVSQEEAIRRIVRAGDVDPETARPLLAYPTIAAAVAAAKRRSERLGQMLRSRSRRRR